MKHISIILIFVVLLEGCTRVMATQNQYSASRCPPIKFKYGKVVERPDGALCNILLLDWESALKNEQPGERTQRILTTYGIMIGMAVGLDYLAKYIRKR